MKEVYLYNKTNTISFVHEHGKSVCIGETDGTLQDFLDWMRKDWEERKIDIRNLPSLFHDKSKL